MDSKDKKSASEKISQRSSNIEEQILAAQKRREDKLFLEELGKRISIAREGKAAMEKGDFSTALTKHRRFLTLTARAQQVEVHELNPNLFEEKARAKESILVSAIFLDLMKMLDKIDSPGARQERAVYHKLFVRFTLGQSFQGYVSENLYKYINSSKTLQHKKEFLATYNQIKNKKLCVVATWAFEDQDAPEVIRLRAFRDDRLAHWPLGPAFIDFYYLIGPRIAATLNRVPMAKSLTKGALKILVKNL